MTQSSSSDHVPTEIGGYQIQRVLGSGGMATVYAALQKQPRRTVAIKVLRAAARSESARRRFRREIEILGRLRHPYIAQVYDAGIHDDGAEMVPYFVMEYVPRARTIIEYCEHRKLAIDQRLRLFVKVCAAVHHGHRNKIIHRDLKPANILIDEQGEPKVIDFGVARAAESDVGPQTIHTETGRLVGTLQYMAPEQLDANDQDLDARCDVYALGVILYKMLTGRRPHDLRGLPVFTAAQVVREDVPARPSTIVPELKGDLEAIILRAMEKDRTRRYPSASSLGRDVVHFLKAQPVNARPAGLAYRSRLFARRHRTELVAASIVLAVIMGAAAFIVLRPPGVIPPVPAPETTEPSLPPPAAVTPERPPAAPDVPDERVSLRITAHGTAIRALAFDPTGRLLATTDETGSLRLWKLSDPGQPVLDTADHDDGITHVAFSADGSRVVTVAGDGQIVVVRRAGGRIDRVVRDVCAPALAMAVAPDASRFALACDDLTLKVYTGDGEPEVLRGTRGAFTAAAFSADGMQLAGATEGGSIRIWDAATGVPRFELGPVEDGLVALAFDGADHLITVTASGDGTRWSLTESPPRSARIAGLSDDADLIATDRSGRWIARLRDGIADVIGADGTRRRPLDEDDTDPVATARALAVDPAGRWVAVGDADGVVHLIPIAE